MVHVNDAVYIHGTGAAEHQRLSALNRLTNPSFLEFLDLRPNDLVLEVGSGLGILAAETARRVPQGRLIGIDRSSAQLGASKFSLANLHLTQADAHDLPFQDAGIDVVYCRYLLEHVANPARVLSEIHRVLKAGGHAFFQENNILVSVLFPDCPKFDRVWRKFAALQERLGGDGVIGKKLFGLLKQAGFAEVRLSIAPEVHHAGQASFDAWIVNLIGNVAGAADSLVEADLSSRAEIQEALDELNGFRKRDDGSAFFYWNRAAARK